jgi:hypothetical protein
MSERYIGMFDILGFSHLIQTNTLEEVVSRAHRFLKIAYGVLTIPGDGASERLSVHVFQDTVIVTSHDTEPVDFKYIITYSSALIGFGFLDGFMLRGAIVQGEAHIESQMVIGKGIVKAYQMEQSQDWMGCWIDTECVEKADNKTVEEMKRGFLINWSVPLKTGLKRKLWALNWTIFPIQGGIGELLDQAWERVWRPSCEENKVLWDVRRKLEATDRFMMELVRRGWMNDPKKRREERPSEELPVPDAVPRSDAASQ